MDVSAPETTEDTMERREQRAIVEALILAAPEPVGASKIAAIVPDCSAALARELVDEINASCAAEGRGFEICEVGGGWQLRTRAEYAAFVQELQPKRAQRLSRAALETLSVIAYRQPITRAEVEHVRGVDVGAVVRGLLERDLIRIAGHREIPGRPMLYATTKRFLQLFGLASLEDLPTLRDLRELTPVEGGDVSASGAVESDAAEPSIGEPPDAGSFADQDDENLRAEDDERSADDELSAGGLPADELDDAFDAPLAAGAESMLGDDSADDSVRKTH